MTTETSTPTRTTVDALLDTLRHDGLTPDVWRPTDTTEWHAWLVEEHAPMCAVCGGANAPQRYESRYDFVVFAVCETCGHAVEV